MWRMKRRCRRQNRTPGSYSELFMPSQLQLIDLLQVVLDSHHLPLNLPRMYMWDLQVPKFS
jgi:hypothetical protein